VCATVSSKCEVSVTRAAMFDLALIHCEDPHCVYERTDKSAAHKTLHLMVQLHDELESADFVFAEQQPPMGLTNVEQSLLIRIKENYSKGRKEFMRLISPSSMHRHFNMSKMKEERRVQVVEIARPWLASMPAFKAVVAKDHLADAMAFILFFVNTRMPPHTPQPPNKYAMFSYVASPRSGGAKRGKHGVGHPCSSQVSGPTRVYTMVGDCRDGLVSPGGEVDVTSDVDQQSEISPRHVCGPRKIGSTVTAVIGFRRRKPTAG
jgi:hypothetical protein